MPFVKNSDEAKANMERVRNARQHKKQLSLSPILKDVKDTHVEFDEMKYICSHQIRVHPYKTVWKGLGYKILFNSHSFLE